MIIVSQSPDASELSLRILTYTRMKVIEMIIDEMNGRKRISTQYKVGVTFRNTNTRTKKFNFVNKNRFDELKGDYTKVINHIKPMQRP